jgi:dihydrofolate reductase
MKIIMMMAMTADGKIARNDNHFPSWTSREDKALFAQITKKHGVVLMGDKTFWTFPAPLSERLNVVFTLDKNPPQIKGVKWVSGEPEKVLAELEKMGYESAILGGGCYLNSLFLRKKLIDEIILTIEPRLFGSGLSLFGDNVNVNLELLEAKKINSQSVMLRYKIIY